MIPRILVLAKSIMVSSLSMRTLFNIRHAYSIERFSVDNENGGVDADRLIRFRCHGKKNPHENALASVNNA